MSSNWISCLRIYCLSASYDLLSNVCFFIPSPAILILLIIFSYAFIISSFVRLRIGLTKKVICAEVDSHHYVPVALLGREGECSSLVGVDGVGEVVDGKESLVGFGDRYLVER